jgi:hypothetical protein
MGVFKTPKEAGKYENKYCALCAHNPPFDDTVDQEAGCFCPVMLAHQNFSDMGMRPILNFLIPVDSGGNLQCRMFLADEQRGIEAAGQCRLPVNLLP